MPAGFVLAQTAQPPAASKVPAAPPAAPQASGQTPVPAVPQPAIPQPSTASVLPPQPPPPEKRGFLNDFGNWWDKSVANFNAKIKEQQSKLDDFNKQSAAATKDAMQSTFDALRPTKLVEMHEVCAIAGLNKIRDRVK